MPVPLLCTGLESPRCPTRPGPSSSCGGSRSATRGSSPTTTSTSSCERGEVHALLGENGAGKSTLMNILYGLTKPDEGEIVVGGKRVSFTSAKDAIEAGIGMVHQHFMLIPVMTVAENIVLGVEPVRDGVLLDEQRRRAARSRALAAVRARGRPDRARLEHHRRPAAAGRDPEGALPRRPDPDPRRADRGADAAGGGRALRDRPQPEGRRQVDHLHQPQAERGARDRRPDHGPPARQDDRHRLAGGCDRRRASHG